jgi:hypothetical protein
MITRLPKNQGLKTISWNVSELNDSVQTKACHEGPVESFLMGEGGVDPDDGRRWCGDPSI